MNITKFKHSFQKYGFIGFVNTLFGKIGIKYRFENHISKTLDYYSKEIEKKSKNEIMFGNYRGIKMIINKSWNSYDLASKYLGIYEQEVQNTIIQSQKKNKKKYFVNVGCGEGYHAISLAKKKIFEKIIGFENSAEAIACLEKNLIINKLKNKAILFKNADINFLNNEIFKKYKLKHCLFLIDIEGGEFKILNKENLNKLKNSKLIIEIHNFHTKPNKLINNLKKFFRISFFTTEYRNPNNFKILDDLHDNEKWLLMSEGRPKKMEWIYCKPK